MGKEYGYLAFRCIPEGLHRRQKLLVAQYDFSGIQRYLFGSNDIFMEEADIRLRSLHVEQLTKELSRQLSVYFSRWGYRVLSLSSGKLICAFSHRTNPEQLQAFSDRFQRQVYAVTGGMLELYYGTAYAVVRTPDKRKESTDVSSLLAAQVSRNKYHCVNLIDTPVNPETAPQLHLTALVSDHPHQPQRRGSAMAIKFDLDNLGAFFGQLHTFDTRKAASDALKDVLENSLDSYIYIGGDDIFAVVPTQTALQVMAQMYQQILGGIMQRPELELYRTHFGISGGIASVEFRDAHIPLIYYLEEAENRLSLAKQHPGKNCIRYEHRLLSWAQLLLLSQLWQQHGNILFPNPRTPGCHACLKDPARLAGLLLQQNRHTAILTSQEVTLLAQIS